MSSLTLSYDSDIIENLSQSTQKYAGALNDFSRTGQRYLNDISALAVKTNKFLDGIADNDFFRTGQDYLTSLSSASQKTSKFLKGLENQLEGTSNKAQKKNGASGLDEITKKGASILKNANSALDAVMITSGIYKTWTNKSLSTTDKIKKTLSSGNQLLDLFSGGKDSAKKGTSKKSIYPKGIPQKKPSTSTKKSAIQLGDFTLKKPLPVYIVNQQVTTGNGKQRTNKTSASKKNSRKNTTIKQKTTRAVRPTTNRQVSSTTRITSSALKKGNLFQRFLGKANLPANIIGAANDIYGIATDKNLTTEEKVTQSSSKIGGVAGGWAGAKIGAAVGSFILPGVGTAIGAALGGLGGYLAGEFAGESLAKEAMQDTASATDIGREVASALNDKSARVVIEIDTNNRVNVKSMESNGLEPNVDSGLIMQGA